MTRRRDALEGRGQTLRREQGGNILVHPHLAVCDGGTVAAFKIVPFRVLS